MKETPGETIERLTAELATAKQTIANYETAKAMQSAEEKIITEKMAVGLTRTQAISVIKHQKAFAEAWAAEEAKKAQAKLASNYSRRVAGNTGGSPVPPTAA
jgi:hypothetical protein